MAVLRFSAKVSALRVPAMKKIAASRGESKKTPGPPILVGF
jgi:hypothetical protein